MEESQPKKLAWKSLFIGGLIISSLYVGDKYSPFRKLNERNFYYNSSVEDGYYQKPSNLEIATIRNNKNRIEVYLVDKIKKDSLPVRENMYVGTMGGAIDDFIDRKKDDVKNWWEKQNTDSTKLMYKLNDLF